MWTSKLGKKYPMSEIQSNDPLAQKELKRLRSLKGNALCADCGRPDNSWASVSHGVFICVTCSDVHRSVGTHISKVKGCTGTYLWGPDELERMQTSGNHHGDEVYGAEKIDPLASKDQKQRFVVEKYEKRSLAGKPPRAQAKPEKPVSVAARDEDRLPVVRRSEVVQPALHIDQISAKVAPVARKANIPDSLFDELFNEAEDSYFGPTLPAKATVAEHTDKSLDAFLNTMLSVQPELKATTTRAGYPVSLDICCNSQNATTKPQAKAATQSDYPVSLDTFCNSQKTAVMDPFADWPEF